MKVMKVKSKLAFLTLLAAIGLFLLGVLVIILPVELVEDLIIIALIGILVVWGTTRLIQCVRIGKYPEGILAFALCWSAAIILFAYDYSQDIFAVIPSIIVGAVSLLMGIMRLLITINCIANKYKGAVRNAISAIICIGFGIFLVAHPINNFGLLSTVAGIYLIIYSITMFGDFFASVFRADMDENRTKRRVHHALPNIINAVKPANMISDINKKIQTGEVKSGMIVEEKESTDPSTVNMEILVHLTTQGANKFGHVDLALGDTIYSYGTYDSSKDKMGGFVSQGTFIIVPKIPYLKYCLDYQKKYVIGFGASLSQKQFEAVQKRIDEILSNSELFECRYEAALKEGEDGRDLNDPASNIVRDVGGKVYTVVKGPFRRYFGINTNCVHVADWILSESGIDAISFSSLRTPGSYYAMLQNMFKRKNTRIIRKTTYILADDIQ